MSLGICLLTLLCAGSLYADRIDYMRGSGARRELQTLDRVTITGWNVRAVNYRGADNRTGSVPTGDILAIDRAGGSMSRELADAIAAIGTNPQRATTALTGLSTSGNDLDKEEAVYRLAQMLGDSARNAQAIAAATAQYQKYTSAYRAGFFARDAYTELAQLQQRAGKVADARATLRAMIGADASLARQGNQLLGEVEFAAKDWRAAATAFKAAETAAGEDRGARALSQAWQGRTAHRAGETAAAREMLEKLVTDDGMQDDPNPDREVAMAVAYVSLGDLQFEAENFVRAYDSYLKAAYFQWWNRAEMEGYCLGQAYRCALKLQGTDEMWKARVDKLRSVMAAGFPRELQEIERN